MDSTFITLNYRFTCLLAFFLWENNIRPDGCANGGISGSSIRWSGSGRCGGVSLLFLKSFLSHQGGGGGNPNHLPSVPEVPGLPVLGNLLQLKEKKPYKTFTNGQKLMALFTPLKTGATSMVVINSNDLAKEALVTRFNSISTRKLSKALKILTADKTMVAMSDYDDYHKTVKRNILTSILGPAALKKHRLHRDTLAENLSNQLHDLAPNSPHEAVNLRKIFQSELFTLALKQTFGRDIKSIYVSDLGTTMTRDEVFQVLVLDPMMGAIEVDWRASSRISLGSQTPTSR
ncbi:putative ent-kaurene monooxygenase [Helianthus annuus]|uniref:Ent-kaurene monooxygenase n=1 Tax=Helianthus annuus TaxID=4232 RepID=A0A9K3JGG0_HELAN|nr:putative ent-kaurene monooxygenase [Helianthus annuus]